jgi:hypothetical protein
MAAAATFGRSAAHPALVAAFILPHTAADPRVRLPTTSNETVNAVASTLLLGIPPAAAAVATGPQAGAANRLTEVDQWIGVAYFLGPRRR